MGHASFTMWPVRCAIAAAILAAAAFAAGAPAMAGDKNVYTLLYYNNGGYTVKSLRVHWIDVNGDEQSKKFNKDMTLGMGFCFNIPDANKSGGISIPEGAEVWLSYNIALGDRKDCRKDGSTVRYKSGSNNGQYYLSEGTTTRNNRCKLAKPPTSYQIGKSVGNCIFDIDGF